MLKRGVGGRGGGGILAVPPPPALASRCGESPKAMRPGHYPSTISQLSLYLFVKYKECHGTAGRAFAVEEGFVKGGQYGCTKLVTTCGCGRAGLSQAGEPPACAI
jgi:hypothetical protein